VRRPRGYELGSKGGGGASSAPALPLRGGPIPSALQTFGRRSTARPWLLAELAASKQQGGGCWWLGKPGEGPPRPQGAPCASPRTPPPWWWVLGEVATTSAHKP
jgi:hypothetical protein